MFVRKQFPRYFVSTVNLFYAVVFQFLLFGAAEHFLHHCGKKKMVFYHFGSVFWICFWQLKGIFPCKITSAVCECWNDFHFRRKICRPNGPLEFKCCFISHLNFFFFELCFRAMASVLGVACESTILLLHFWLALYAHGLWGFLRGLWGVMELGKGLSCIYSSTLSLAHLGSAWDLWLDFWNHPWRAHEIDKWSKLY